MQKTDRLLVIGPSGGGKSTLLRCVMGLEDVQGGEIKVDGKNYIAGAPIKTTINAEMQKQIGMVFRVTRSFLISPCLATSLLRPFGHVA